jgi:hypothetical protein
MSQHVYDKARRDQDNNLCLLMLGLRVLNHRLHYTRPTRVHVDPLTLFFHLLKYVVEYAMNNQTLWRRGFRVNCLNIVLINYSIETMRKKIMSLIQRTHLLMW